MTAASSVHTPATVGAGGSGAWLYGRWADLLLGAGLGYLLSVPLLVAFTRLSGEAAWPVAAGALFAMFASGPHYGATLLRVYEHRHDRRKYALFTVWTTLALCGLFVAALHGPWLGSLLVTAYATWSPWHFSGQNYGVALMFLRRRGIAVEPAAKRCLYTSFGLSFALAFLVLHGERAVVTYASVPVSHGSLYQLLSIGIPRAVVGVLVPVTALAYVGSLVGAGVLLLRHARPRDLVPVVCLVLVQALWFALPAALPVIAGTPLHGLAFTVVWISTAHALQYLWVTSYYARREDASERLGGYFVRTLLAGSAVTVFPALLFAPGLLGRVPWDVGLAILLFSVVNLHHFILDGAIWKLRDGRVSRLLLRDASPAAEPPAAPAPARSPLRALIAGLGVVSLAVAAVDLWQREYVINRAGADLGRVQRAAARLAWIGRDNPGLHTQLAAALATRGQPGRAMEEYRRSLALHPTAAAWSGIARIHAGRGDWQLAAEALDEALALDADDVPALLQRARVERQRGDAEAARRHLLRARELAPRNASIRAALERLDAGS